MKRQTEKRSTVPGIAVTMMVQRVVPVNRSVMAMVEWMMMPVNGPVMAIDGWVVPFEAVFSPISAFMGVVVPVSMKGILYFFMTVELLGPLRVKTAFTSIQVVASSPRGGGCKAEQKSQGHPNCHPLVFHDSFSFLLAFTILRQRNFPNRLHGGEFLDK